MKERLAILCAYNPNNVLLETVTALKQYYNEFDIVIVDSDSQNKEIYKELPDNCIVEYYKNKNYELGAWVYAFNKYSNYNVYMCIQDTLTPTCRIPNFSSVHYTPRTVYTFHYSATLEGGGI